MADELAPKRRGWTRKGRKGAFRYFDRDGREIRDPVVVERIERLAIPPAWKDVTISPSRRAKLQATGYDRAGRKQYLYHPDFRAAQEQAKYDGLIRFAERLPALRIAMAEHLDRDGLDRERVSAIALRLINLGWFRVGSERHARESRTYGITTLTRRHVAVRGHRISLSFRGKHQIQVRTTFVDDELASAMRELLGVPGGARVFRTKGDANPVKDPWTFTLTRPTQARVAFHLPYVGYAFAALAERKVRMILIGVPALLVALSVLAGLWREAGEAAAEARRA